MAHAAKSSAHVAVLDLDKFVEKTNEDASELSHVIVVSSRRRTFGSLHAGIAARTQGAGWRLPHKNRGFGCGIRVKNSGSNPMTGTPSAV